MIDALYVEGREKVDQMMNKTMRAGGRDSRQPQDHGWVYGRGFEDIDGHLWEIIYMDESAMNNADKKIMTNFFPIGLSIKGIKKIFFLLWVRQ